MNDNGVTTKMVSVTPVIDTMPADLLTPLSVYLKLSRASRNSFLLESVEGGESLGRYSFIGVDPEMLVRGDAESATVTDESGETTINMPMFDFLREHFAKISVPTHEELPAFIGGAIGYLGFDCSGWFEPSLRQPAREDGPDAAFMFFRSVIAFDHAKQVVKIISLVLCDASNNAGFDERSRTACERNAEIRRTLDNEPVVIPPNRSGPSDAAVSSNWTQDKFETAVSDIKELIRAGECYQVVLSQCFSRPTSAHPVAIYRALRSLNPSPYMFLLQMPDRYIIGASPEMLVKSFDNNLEYRPIAGTRRRGKTAAEDAELGEDMRNDKKEVAEHLMLVDLGRNDLGRVSEYGSVTVKDLLSVEKFSHVQHLVSYLSGKLRNGLDRFDALAACFPAGTVSGAPKVRATEIIQALEPDPRGLYAGAVGYFD